MRWDEALLPAAVIVAGIRAEARLIGPYWSWLELITWQWPHDAAWRRRRRNALMRRALVATVVVMLARLIGRVPSLADGAIIGALSGAITVWPALASGPSGPLYLRKHQEIWLYTLFVAMTTGAASTGWLVGDYIATEGGPSEYARAQGVQFVLSLIVVAFSGSRFKRLGDSAHEIRDLDGYPSRALAETNPVAARALTRRAWSGTVLRWTRTVSDRVVDLDMQVALVGLLIIETEERRTGTRALEWCVAWIDGVLHRRRARTLGPLQLRSAPWNRNAAVDAAVKYIHDCGIDVTSDASLARCWHGASSRQPGELVSYEQCLEFARSLAADVVQAVRPNRAR